MMPSMPRTRSAELLAAVGIPAPEQRLTQYPHQLSGGMRQRVAIAIALVLRAEAPDRRRADHRARCHDPGADPRSAARASSARRHMAMILITHDLGVVAGRTDEVAVMYAGRVVEARADARFVQRRCACPIPRRCWRRSRSSTPRRIRRCPRSRGAPPDPTAAAQGCSFRAALPLCGRALSSAKSRR